MHKFSLHKSFLSLFFVVSALYCSAQTVNFQRLFPGVARQTFHLGSQPIDDAGFYMVNVFVDNATMEFGLNVSKHDQKGNIQWSNDYIPEGVTGYLFDFRRIDIEKTGGDTIVLSGHHYDENGLGNGNYVLQIEPRGGDVTYSGSIFNDDNTFGISVFPKMVQGINGETNYIGTHGGATGRGLVHVEKFDGSFNSLAGTSFVPQDSDGEEMIAGVYDGAIMVDSNLAISTLLIENGATVLDEIGLLTIDSFSNIVSGNKYSLANPGYDGFQVLGMATTPDTGIVSVGAFTDLLTQGSLGFIFKTDSTGQVAWSHQLDPVNNFSLSLPNSVLNTFNDEILVTGKTVDLLAGEVGDYAIFFDQEGNVLRQSLYSSQNSFFLDLGSGLAVITGDLHNSPDGSILYSTQGVDFVNGIVFSPLAIKMSGEGAAICNDTLDAQLISELNVLRDTLVFGLDTVVMRDTLNVDKEFYDGYDVPFITLLDTVFCPQDPIVATIDATEENASSYLWSTGDTTASITVFEEGEYMVTVTFEDRVCFELCDTSIIAQLDFPEADINPDLTVPCEVTLSPTSTTDIVAVFWSTGDSTLTITVTEPGTYTVTILDSCGNTADASLTLGEAIFTLAPAIAPDDTRLCEFGEFELFVNANIPIAQYEWSTGETSESILVSSAGVYSVTVTDICGNVEVATFEFEDDDFVIDLEVGINRDFSRLCEFMELRLWATSNNQVASYQWSTGDTTQRIDITMAGVYSVTITDICGNQETAEVTISPAEVDFSFDVSIDVNTDFINTQCALVLSAVVNNNAYTETDYMWSNGSGNTSINILDPGVYSVSVTNDCGQVEVGEITIDASLFDGQDLAVSIQTTGGCPDTLSALVTPSLPVTYEWSTGETVDSIIIDEGGTYLLTVRNACDEEFMASYSTSDNLMFPNIFFPNSQNHNINREFKPYLSCPDFFTGEGYRLEVYNRFGNRVFESDNVDNGWRGDHNNTPAASGVYMFFATWSIDGGEETVQGDVTLMR